jgi:CheY-like chemotaxis protein
MSVLDYATDGPHLEMKCRILLVEDSESDAFLVSELLQLMGHMVEIAHNGREALRKLLTFTPHLILCDIMMPEMDGLTFAQRLRDGEGRTAVLVALTERAEFADGEYAKDCGFDYCLAKPISITELQQLLETFAN